ncbi:MAG: peptidase S8 [Verrucomicrobia bacterium]|nr:peptidase S8 [Verrucomicrobiota bacterium]
MSLIHAKLRYSTVAGIAAVLTTHLTAFSQALPPVPIAPGGPLHAPGEVLVQFRNTVTQAEANEVFRRGGLGLLKHIRTPAMADRGHIGVVRALTALPVPVAVQLLNQLPGVEFAEPNWVATRQAESNDPFYADPLSPGPLWGMFGDDLSSPIGPAGSTTIYGTQAEKAWAAGFTGSSEVLVGIVDGGLQLDHPDLAANIWTNPDEIPGNGIDDDGNGYVDDVHGWNAYDNNGDVRHVDDVTDTHGTHVAGTIGAVGGNGLGVAGVNWNVKLVAGKMFGAGYYSDAIEAIDYLTSLKTRKGLDVVVVNHSWGGSSFSQALLDAFNRAAQAGILSVASAGNEAADTDASPRYPTGFDTTPVAGYDAIVSVAAISRQGGKSSFSNYGRHSVDLGAPGGERVNVNDPSLRDPDYEIVSTVPPSSYGYKRGTSMAAPHVTGAIALYAAAYPQASAEQIRYDLLVTGVRPLAGLQGVTVTGGTLDIWTMVDPNYAPPSLPTKPTAPSNLTATALSIGKGASLSWLDRSANESGFTIERRTTSTSPWLIVATVNPNTTKYTDATAARRTSYTYRVRAINVAGSSTYSNAVTVKTK